MHENSIHLQDPDVPLCVDLDGTLIRSDVLWESMLLLLRANPLYLFVLPFWFLRGRAHLKQEIANRTHLNPENLPYHLPFMEFLREERKSRRLIILATASDRLIAEAVAKHVGLFDGVLASEGTTNMRGSNKSNELIKRYGRNRFDYAGNSSVDLGVWKDCRHAIVVNADDSLVEKAGKISKVSKVFNEHKSQLRLILKSLRPHQWVKNLLIFVPLVTSHKLDASNLFKAGLAFLSFSLCASAVYVLNDLLDLESDRHHAKKKNRPFASGQLDLPVGLVMAPALLAASFALGWSLHLSFIFVLACYFVMTTAYSLRLKQLALVDVFFLAGLYTMRLIAGHTAATIAYSFWLLTFSLFIFLSLALVKRYTELNLLLKENKRYTKGRGYTTDDVSFVAMLGISSGFMAALVMALYVNSMDVQILYHHPKRLLPICPLMWYWISHVWLKASRGRMHDDPIVFALKDWLSYLIGALCIITLRLANIG